jgi:hypothetical protein
MLIFPEYRENIMGNLDTKRARWLELIKEQEEIRMLLQNGMQCIFSSGMEVAEIGQLVRMILSC